MARALPRDAAEEPVEWLTPSELDSWLSVVRLMTWLPWSIDQQLRRDSNLAMVEYQVLITRMPRSRESPRSGDDISPASRQALDGPAPRRFRREGGSDMTSPGEGGQLTFARDIRRPFRTKDRASMRSAFDLSATRMLPSMPTPSVAPALITGERGRRGPGRYR